MRPYDYVTDGTPIVDEELASPMLEFLATLDREQAAWFWETQAEIFVPEARAELLALNVSQARDHYLDVHTRETVWGFVNCFTPMICSMH